MKILKRHILKLGGGKVLSLWPGQDLDTKKIKLTPTQLSELKAAGTIEKEPK